MSNNTRNYYERGLDSPKRDERKDQNTGDDMTTANKICIVIFGLLGLILLPVTGLWALFAYLAGDKYPLYALRGENVDDDLIDNP